MRAALAVSVLALLLASCPTTPELPDTGPEIGPDGAVDWIEIGTGELSFVPLDDGDPVELVHGPQGGYHLQVTCRIHVANPDALTLHYRAFREDGTMLGDVGLAINERRLVREGMHWLRAASDRLILDITGPADVVNTHLRIEAVLTNLATPIAADSRRIFVVDEQP